MGLRYLWGQRKCFTLFFPLATVLLIYPKLTEKHKGLKSILGAASLAFIIILAVIVSGIGNYSAPGLLRYNWPVIEVVRKANLPFILQTFGLFLTAAWLPLTLAGTGLFYYVLAEGSAQLLGILNYKWFTLIFFPIVYFAMILLCGIVEARFIFSYFRVIGFLLTVGIPIFVWLQAVIGRRGVKKDAA